MQVELNFKLTGTEVSLIKREHVVFFTSVVGKNEASRWTLVRTTWGVAFVQLRVWRPQTPGISPSLHVKWRRRTSYRSRLEEATKETVCTKCTFKHWAGFGRSQWFREVRSHIYLPQLLLKFDFPPLIMKLDIRAPWTNKNVCISSQVCFWKVVLSMSSFLIKNQKYMLGILKIMGIFILQY
jgi:hypothetical protein